MLIPWGDTIGAFYFYSVLPKDGYGFCKCGIVVIIYAVLMWFME